MFSQIEKPYSLEMSYSTDSINEDFITLRIQLSNKSSDNVVINNPDFYLLNEKEKLFWIPMRWRIGIICNDSLTCVPEGALLRVNKRLKGIERIIKSGEEYTFKIPINMKKLYYLDGILKQKISLGKDKYNIQLQLRFIKPEDVVIESNEIKFEL